MFPQLYYNLSLLIDKSQVKSVLYLLYDLMEEVVLQPLVIAVSSIDRELYGCSEEDIESE